MNNQNEMKSTASEYDRKYKGGYGVQYPDGHVIRFYERYLKNEMPKGTLFDFGCGNGVHTKFFQTKGFDVFGVDIIEQAIKEARNITNKNESAFRTIELGQDLLGLWPPSSFDVVFANQSLYYLDDKHLNECIKQLHALLKRGGVFFATMMSTKNVYYRNVEEKMQNGLSKVVLHSRLHETTYINFIDSDEELKRTFGVFRCVHCGQYEPFSYLGSLDEDGCSHHYIFIGRKN